MSLMNRISNLFSRARTVREIDAELQSHIEMRIEDNLAAGMSPEEARRDARLRFGNLAVMKDKVAAMDMELSLDRILADIKFAGRLLRRNPMFASLVIAIMALAIGTASVSYSVVDVWLVRNLPFRDAHRLVALWRTDPRNPGDPAYFTSWRDYRDWGHASNSIQEMAGFTWRQYTLKGNTPERVLAQVATPNLFSMLGAYAAYGRAFSPADLNHNPAVLSYELWQHRFNGSKNILGTRITLNENSYTVVGVMPRGFIVPSLAEPDRVDVWVPLAPDDPAFASDPTSPLAILAYLRGDHTMQSAQQELSAISQRLDPEDAKTQGILVVGLQADLSRSIRSSLLLLMAAVGLILFIACFNVAGLLTNRAIERTKEISVRTALGARRSQIVRQLFIEAALLGLISGALGVGVSVGGLKFLLTMHPFTVPPPQPISINLRIMAFTAALTLVTSCAFGLLPALAAPRVNLNSALKQTSRSVSAGKGRKFLRTVLLICQVSLSVLLLVSAGLLGRSFLRLESLPLGFQPEHILTAEIYAPAEAHASIEAWNRARNELFRTLEAMPGVKETGSTTHLPFTNAAGYPIAVEGRPPAAPDQSPVAAESLVTPRYFGTMQVPLLRGRDFADGDQKSSVNVAIINREAAQVLFANQNPLGLRIKSVDPSGKAPWFSIVGIVGNTRSYTYNSMEWKIRPEVFFPFAQAEAAGLGKQALDYGKVVMRTASDSSASSRQFREAIAHLEPNAAAGVHVMNDRVSAMLFQPKLRAVVVGVFAILALLLVAMGLYGVMSQTVMQQTRDIGTRMALGAQRSDVLKLILGQGTRVVLTGLGIGIALSLAATRLLRSFLYDISAFDPVVLTAVCLVLLGIGLFAAYVPARYASRLDPVTVLHDE
jgi:putative ABC transport system permease protein